MEAPKGSDTASKQECSIGYLFRFLTLLNKYLSFAGIFHKKSDTKAEEDEDKKPNRNHVFV